MIEFITPAEVRAIAFTDGEYVASECIAPCDIAAATERWVVPVVGRVLLEAVAEGRYAELKEEYLKPVIALYTRLLVQPCLNASTSQLGLSVSSTSARRAADSKAREELQRALRQRAHFLKLRLSDYLNDNADAFEEYDARKNILNSCRCDGGFVQIR
ncbi:MAG: hypothetical protein IKY82_02665 [Alistipes sp.]|nr:hypothetical protein [Alistipes sp.]